MFNRNLVKDKPAVAGRQILTNLNLSRGSQGYVWKPWLLKWESQMNVGINSQLNLVDASPNPSDASTEALARTMGGSLNIQVVPESRFPFRANYDYNNADSSEGTAGGQGGNRQKLSLSQDYRNLERDSQLGVRLDLSRDMSGTKNISGFEGISIPSVGKITNDSKTQSMSVSWNKRLTTQTVDVFGKMDNANNSTQDTIVRSRDKSVVLRHDYTGGPSISVNSMGSWSLSDIQNTNISPMGRQDSLWNSQWEQINNSIFWRPEGKSYSVVSTSRVSQNTTLTDSGAGTETSSNSGTDGSTGSADTNGERIARLLNSNLGLNYQFSPAWNLSGRVAGNSQETIQGNKTASQMDATQSVQTSYSPDRILLGPLIYNWSTSGAFDSSERQARKPKMSMSERIGHSLAWQKETGPAGFVEVSCNQKGSASHVSQAVTLWNIDHSGTLRWDDDRGESRTYTELTLTDTRTLGVDPGYNQLANVQLSRSGMVGKGATWKGNFSTQWSLRGSDGKSDSKKYSRGELSLAYPDLLRIPGLRFISSLAIDVDNQYLPMGNLIGNAGLRESRQFWNRLDYQLGKIVVGLNVGVQETDGWLQDDYQRNTVIMFDIRRYFETVF
ncbi:MAG: hypothetical protein H7833_15545 [Magnetococcus sp. DMHC-1]|nr:hypothetical protein [Magnetococcales bacterium]